MEHESDDYTNCNWGSCYSHQRTGTRIRGLGNNSKGGDHSNYSIVEISQNNEKSFGDLGRLVVTQTSLRTHRLTEKNPKIKSISYAIVVKTKLFCSKEELSEWSKNLTDLTTRAFFLSFFLSFSSQAAVITAVSVTRLLSFPFFVDVTSYKSYDFFLFLSLFSLSHILTLTFSFCKYIFFKYCEYIICKNVHTER